MKISVCIIALNEERVIKRVLNCVKKFADEIIFVDTGSCDKTVRIAKEFTDKIYFFKWIDDFSKARNYAFSKSTGDYLFWIDADDFISDDNIEKILKIKKSTDLKDTYMFKYSCGFDKDGKPSLTFYRERLLKNCSKAKFVGFVHEVVAPFGNIEYSDVEIEHRKEICSNSKRNLNLYKKHLPISNFTAREIYYFAKEYFYLGYYKTSVKLLKKFLNCTDKFAPDEKDALLTLSYCYKILGENNYVDFLFTALKTVGLDCEILCKIGDYFLEKNDFLNAEKYFKCALSLSKNDCIGFCNTEYYHLYPLLQLIYLNFKVGNYSRSLYYHELCKLNYLTDKRVEFNENFFKQSQKNK